MSPLVMRLLLAVSLIPLAIGLLFFATIVGDDLLHLHQEKDLLFSTIVTMGFVFAYWTLLWRKVIVWTRRRVRKTLIATFIAALIGAALTAAIAALIEPTNRGWVVLISIGALATTTLWLFASTLAWRETPSERALRTNAAARGDLSAVLLCGHCGYAMTGLTHARCPECGTEHTLDALFADALGRIDPDRQLADPGEKE